MSNTTAPRRALLVIDVQNEYFTGDMPIEYPSVDISLPNIVQAMAAARAAGVPVIVVQHDAPEASPIFAKGSDGWQLHPQVAAFAADHRINKTMGSAFAGTDLRAWLDSHGTHPERHRLHTHNCDAATIYQAAHDGVQVEFLQDHRTRPTPMRRHGQRRGNPRSSAPCSTRISPPSPARRTAPRPNEASRWKSTIFICRPARGKAASV